MKYLLIFVLLLSCVFTKNLPKQFTAETKVLSKEDGVTTAEQYDYISFDGVSNRSSVVSVNEIFDTNFTHIYRGDLNHEYLIRGTSCVVLECPSELDSALVIDQGVQQYDDVVINGVVCEFWATVVEVHSHKPVMKYYLKKGTNIPVRFEMIYNAGTFTTIDFVKFIAEKPAADVFEPPVFCQKTKLQGFEQLPTRKELMDHLTISDIEHNHPEPLKGFETTPNEAPEKRAIDPATLAMIGKTVWAIVKENKPEVNIHTNTNAVIPEGTTWTDMSGWKQQVWDDWEWKIVNLYGVTTVNYNWNFAWLCLGNYNDIGRYIENAGAIPRTVHSSWGFTVDVSGEILNPFNTGTRSDPVASITLVMTMDVETLVSKINRKCTVNLSGDCSSQLVSCYGYISGSTFTY
eukprot:TRINITY_DN12113_c0_g1_i1.p1 TRINITY_DN12113_c0_g1~~TRINITY_DN12113_c0_g1_i1.p1  ORF type:complete len:404 (+),score=90.05 TRINITY_DN12113_c0_g1_i1:40-1251(+)